MLRTYYSLLLSLLFLLFLTLPASHAQSCDFIEGLTADERISCGQLEVPENHAEPNGPKIKIAYVLIKAKTPNKERYPMINFSGGPGGTSIHPSSIRSWAKNPLGQERDIVIFDQRGIGYSSPLPNMGQDLYKLMSLNLTEEEEQVRTDELVKKYKGICDKKGIGLGHYNSFQNAKDVGMLMEHLGYKTYNIAGGSYGTRLARVVQDMFPDRIHSSLINSPNPLGEDFLISRLKSYSLALSRVFTYCEGEEECRSKYPNLKKSYLETISQIKKKPLSLDIDGEDFYVNAQDAIYLIRRLLYGNASRRNVPELIMALKAGQGKIINNVIRSERGFSDFYNFSMWISVERYEMFHEAYTPEKIASIYKKNPLFPASLGMFTALYTATKQHWHQAILPKDQRDFKQSSVPTIIMVNHYDPVTPPENGYVFQKKLGNSFLYILDEGGHGGGNQDCRVQVMEAFMQNPQKEPDTSCLNIYHGK